MLPQASPLWHHEEDDSCAVNQQFSLSHVPSRSVSLASIEIAQRQDAWFSALTTLGVRPLCLVIVLPVKGLRYYGGAKRPQAAANLAF